MVKFGVVTIVALAAMMGSARADQRVWTVDNWPGDIDLIPCDAWSRTADGGWVLTGGAIKLGASVINDIRVRKSDAAGRKLERSCGAK